LLHSARMKWVIVVVLAIIGVLAAIVAIEYFVVPIHSLPSYIPGHQHTPGHYRKRGAVAALVAVVALVAAGVLAVRILREGAAPAAASGSTADQLLGKSTPTPEEPSN
jgi:drug/metabolite transporter (DMT)-like permease